MGLVLSGLDNYKDVYKMPLDMEINFQKQQLDQAELIKGEAQRSMLANLIGLGGLGGGGGAGALNQYGASWQFWDSVSFGVAHFGWIMVLLGLVLALVAGFAKLGKGAMFGGTFVGMFFFVYLVAYYSTSGRMFMVTYKPALVSLMLALVVALVVTFGLYAPAEKKSEGQQGQGKGILSFRSSRAKAQTAH